MEHPHSSLGQITSIHLRLTNRPPCIQMLGSDQSQHGAFRRFWSVVSETSAWNYLAGPHHQHRGYGMHWHTCCQWDHISTKTVHNRLRVENATLSRRLQSSLKKSSYDWQRRPGRPRKFWLVTIHRDLQQLDIDLHNVPELAADCLLWRGLIHGATHHSGARYWWWWWTMVTKVFRL